MIKPMLCGAAALMMVPTAAATEVVRLAPVSSWNLHYGENSCRLGRTFGDKANPTTLMLERASPGTPMSLVVSGGAVKASPTKRKASAHFTPLDKVSFETGTVLKTVEKLPAILWMHVDFAALPDKSKDQASRSERPVRDLAKEGAERTESAMNAARVTALTIVEPDGRTIVLETGKLGRVHTMMLECAREQLQAWGIDPAIEDKIVRPAWSQRGVARLFSPRDYPSGAARWRAGYDPGPTEH